MNRLKEDKSLAAKILTTSAVTSAATLGSLGGLATYNAIKTNNAISANKELNLGLSKKECRDNSSLILSLKDFIYSGNNGGSIESFVSYLEKKDDFSDINYFENENNYSLNYTLTITVPVYGYEKGYSDKYNKYRIVGHEKKQIEKSIEIPKSAFSFSFSFNESQKKIFKCILREADKSRFIKPVWDSLQKYNSGEMMNDVSEDIGERKNSEDLPTYEEILKFSNSNASDKYKIDWNKFSKPDPDTWWNESKKLIVSYIDYLKSNKKKNPKGQFQNENFKIMGENKKWLFVAPLNYEAGVYCDSYECGGYGAQWCIGYERSDEYWYKYTQKNKSRFVMAYNKEIYGNPNEQKFMIDIMKDSSIGVWNQVDDEAAVFGIDVASKKFGISQEDINNWKSQLDEIFNVVKCFSTFSFSEAQKMTRTVNDIDEIKFIPDGQSVYLKEEENQGHGLNILMRTTLASFIKDNSRDVREFVYYGPQYSNKDFSCNSIKMGAYDDLYNKPKLLFFGLNSFKATRIYSDFEAIPICFENCETVKIGSIVIPVPYGEEKKIKEDLKAWGPSTLFFQTYDIPISFSNCKNVIIDNLFFAPCDKYESVNPSVTYNQEGHDGDWWWNIEDDYYDAFDGEQKLSVNSQLFPRLTLNFYTKSKFEDTFADLIDVNTKTIFIDKIIEEPSRPFQKICVINCPFGWEVESENDLAYEIVTVPRYSKKWDNIKESSSLNEGKDYKYRAKVGDLYLQGKDFTSDPEEADVFESETEPRQRINQMKKDKKRMPKGEIAMEKYEEFKKNIFKNILKESMDESEESVAWDKGYELYEPGQDPAKYNPYSPTGRLSVYFMEGWNAAKSDNE